MVIIKKRTGKDFLEAAKAMNYYEEALFYMDFLWGLHPHFGGYIPLAKWIFWLSVNFLYVSLTLVMLIDEYNGIETLKKSDILSPSVQVGFILIAYKVNAGVVRDLIEKAQRFWPVGDDDEDLIRKPFRYVEYFIVFYKTAILGTTIYYNIVALVDPNVVFPTECYQFCDISNPFCYWFIFCFIDVAAFVLVWGIYTFDGFFAGSVAQLIGQLRLIKKKLENLDFENASLEEVNKRDLVEVIQHHAFVLGFVEDINSLYTTVLFTQFSSLIFSMCIGSFLLTLNGRPTINTLTQYVVYLTCMFTQVFIYSFGGQTILDETASIAESAYQTNWFHAKIAEQKTVSTIIMKSQQEAKISVGGFSNLDLRMYLYAAKTSFSFYTMMNQMYQEDSTN